MLGVVGGDFCNTIGSGRGGGGNDDDGGSGKGGKGCTAQIGGGVKGFECLSSRIVGFSSLIPSQYMYVYKNIKSNKIADMHLQDVSQSIFCVPEYRLYLPSHRLSSLDHVHVMGGLDHRRKCQSYSTRYEPILRIECL